MPCRVGKLCSLSCWWSTTPPLDHIFPDWDSQARAYGLLGLTSIHGEKVGYSPLLFCQHFNFLTTFQTFRFFFSVFSRTSKFKSKLGSICQKGIFDVPYPILESNLKGVVSALNKCWGIPTIAPYFLSAQGCWCACPLETAHWTLLQLTELEVHAMSNSSGVPVLQSHGVSTGPGLDSSLGVLLIAALLSMTCVPFFWLLLGLIGICLVSGE